MNRFIKSATDEITTIKDLPELPGKFEYLLYKDLKPIVEFGDVVSKGTPIAKGKWQMLHAASAGKILSVDDNSIVVEASHSDNQISKLDNTKLLQTNPLDFAVKNGLIGMGGAGFPSAIKWNVSKGLDTLVINAVECEPYCSVDQSVLLYYTETVMEGAKALQQALNIKNIILAVRKSFFKQISSKWYGDVLKMSDRYPGGAERLIVEKLSGSPLPAGELPSTRGCLIHNATTLYSVGKCLRNGMPVTERPISFVDLSLKKSSEWLVPVGTVVQNFLDIISVDVDKEKQRLVAGGPMMGKEISPHSTIDKNTTAITLVTDSKRFLRDELPCTGCGSCNDVCPLGLHPIELVSRIRSGKLQGKSFEIQLNECFFCGACSAVCPSDIPLADVIRKERQK